jgi:hypothetical protein
MVRVHCEDCEYLDKMSFCRLNPVIPNMRIHIHNPKEEWCGQGKLKSINNEADTGMLNVVEYINSRKEITDREDDEERINRLKEQSHIIEDILTDAYEQTNTDKVYIAPEHQLSEESEELEIVQNNFTVEQKRRGRPRKQ